VKLTFIAHYSLISTLIYQFRSYSFHGVSLTKFISLQAALMLAKAFGDAGEGLVELRRIEAAEDIAYQLAKSRNVVYLPTGQSTLLNLPSHAQ